MKVTVPTSVPMGEYKKDTKKNKIGDKKKPFALNLNVFRNASSFLIKAADVKFREYVAENYPELRESKFKKIALVYTIYFGNSRKRDLMNIGAVVDKLFSDSLTEMGVIEDDNHTILPLVMFQSQVDIGKERCEVEIIDIENLSNEEIGKIVSSKVRVTDA